MPAFILRRFLSSLIVLFIVVSLTFLLARLQKGGPFDKEKTPEHVKKVLEEKYHLSGSLWQQYTSYISELFLHGNPGVSTKYKDISVVEIIGQKMPNSIALGGCAFIIASVGGVTLGMLAARRKDSWIDVTAMFFAVAAITVPTFITGPLLIAVFGLWFKWLPVGGLGTWRQLILPSLCLAAPYLAYVARLMRNSLLDVMNQNYIRTARAKGLDDTSALIHHAMKVAILPVLTYLGPMAAYVLTGSFIIENVFNITGAGGLFVNAIQNADCFILCGAVVVYCVLLVTFNFIVDVLYGVLDKRIQMHG